MQKVVVIIVVVVGVLVSKHSLIAAQPGCPGEAKTIAVMPVCGTSSSRMRVLNHNWSDTKRRPHPQSIAEISRHSILSGDRIQQCETSSGSRHKDTDQCL